MIPSFEHPIFLTALIPLLILIIFLLFKTFVHFRTDEEAKEYHKRFFQLRIFVLFSRIFVVSLLVIALSSPFIVDEDQVKGEASVKVLLDNSTSMDLFSSSQIQTALTLLSAKIPLTIEHVGYDLSSPLGDGVLQAMKGNDQLLLITDGNNNEGKVLADVVLLANSLNTTIHALQLTPLHEDSVVSLIGSDEVIIGGDAEFVVQVSQTTAKEYVLSVKADNEIILSQAGTGDKSYTITKKLSEGYHKIVAEISIDDYFKENNVYYKAVHVIPKPHILIYSKTSSSPFIESAKQLYDASVQSQLPADLSPYSVVVLNDISLSDITDDVKRLIEYVTDGNGLFVMGGSNSYDRGSYRNSLFESLLPVKTGSPSLDEGEEISTVIVLDISGSSGSSFVAGKKVTKIDVEKGLAIDLIEQFKSKHKVGVIAFNTESFELSPVSQIGIKKTEVVATVQKLIFGGGTIIGEGIKKAREMVIKSPGSKNIILFSDGNTMFPDQTIQEVQQAGFGTIRTYAVGVGFDTNEKFMKQIALAGGGIYFRPEESEKLQLIFGEPLDEDDPVANTLSILNNHHFITEHIELKAKMSGYNPAIAKTTASTLITAGDGAPILVTWRFGLGRVISLLTDDGSKFSGDLYKQENAKLISRMINWAVGNPGRLQETSVLDQTQDDGTIRVLVHTKKEPTGENINVRKVEADVYEVSLPFEKPGFYTISGVLAAVSYDDEFAKTGRDEQLEKLVESTGGKMVDANKIDTLVEKIQKSATRTVMKKKDVKWYFMLPALLIFAVEIVIRRIFEMKQFHS